MFLTILCLVECICQLSLLFFIFYEKKIILYFFIFPMTMFSVFNTEWIWSKSPESIFRGVVFKCISTILIFLFLFCCIVACKFSEINKKLSFKAELTIFKKELMAGYWYRFFFWQHFQIRSFVLDFTFIFFVEPVFGRISIAMMEKTK